MGEQPYRPRRRVGKTPPATDPLVRELLEATLIANLATLEEDGSVHLVAMWFLWDGESILIPTSARTRKAKNLRRDPRVTVMIDDSKGGFDLRGVTIVGDAELVEPPAALALNRSIHEKYVTTAGLELPPVRRYLATDDVTIRVRPRALSSWNLRDTEQAQALAASGAFHALEPTATPK
jgi:PPOX class probable F420-dependent enzyme